MSRRSNPSQPQPLRLPPEQGSIYERALTHRSYAFEQDGPIEHNERLEFLGDAILGAIVAEIIFQRYPDMSEGEMTRLRAAVVRAERLAGVARRLRIGEQIRLGKGEESSGGRAKPSLLADTLEALIAALYLDKGLKEARRFVSLHFTRLLDEAVAGDGGHDAKSALQELVMRRDGELPSYEIAASGPEHDRRFTARVLVDGEMLGTGGGRTKKEAEQEAAARALASLGAGSARGHEGERDARAS